MFKKSIYSTKRVCFDSLWRLLRNYCMKFVFIIIFTILWIDIWHSMYDFGFIVKSYFYNENGKAVLVMSFKSVSYC